MKDASSVIPEGQLAQRRVEEGNPLDSIPPGIYTTANILNVGFTTEDLRIGFDVRNFSGEVIGRAYMGGRFENHPADLNDAEGMKAMDINSTYPHVMTGLSSDE